MLSLSKSEFKGNFILSMSILATIASTVLFSARRIALYDFNFIANAVHRISLGELPYRDFDLVLPPITFLPPYFFHHFVGFGINTSILISAIFTQAIALMALNSILLRLFQKQENVYRRLFYPLAMTCAAVINVISVYPNYIYDSVASALALVMLAYLLKYLESNKCLHLILWQLFALLVFFTKFNMGGSLIFGVVTFRVVTLVKMHQLRKLAFELLSFSALLLFFLIICSVFGLSHFIDQTVIEPSKFKEVTSLDHLAAYKYPLLITILTAIALSLKFKLIQKHFTRYTINLLILLLGINLFLTLFTLSTAENVFGRLFPSASFAYPILMLLAFNRLLASQNSRAEIVLFLFAIPTYFFGTFLSQGWGGSSYSLYPLLVLLLITIHLSLDVAEQLKLRAAIFSLVLLLTVNFFTIVVNGNRLPYVFENGVRGQSFNWSQIGMASSNQDRSHLSEVRKVLDQENKKGTLVEFPAEDLLQEFSAQLTPWGRCLQFTFICPTKLNNQILYDFITDVPDFVVIKKDSQIDRSIEPILTDLEPILKLCFSEKYINKTYQLFKAKENTQACVVKALSASDA